MANGFSDISYGMVIPGSMPKEYLEYSPPIEYLERYPSLESDQRSSDIVSDAIRRAHKAWSDTDDKNWITGTLHNSYGHCALGWLDVHGQTRIARVVDNLFRRHFGLSIPQINDHPTMFHDNCSPKERIMYALKVLSMKLGVSLQEENPKALRYEEMEKLATPDKFKHILEASGLEVDAKPISIIDNIYEEVGVPAREKVRERELVMA